MSRAGTGGMDMGLIPVTHVGSLPRSQEVVDLLSNRERGEAIDSAAFDATMRAAVDLTVARQIASGVDIVSDGETSKTSPMRPT
jgi:5-methyltetrahydropteroyltriglutamate--homocysteine methyltransferase